MIERLEEARGPQDKTSLTPQQALEIVLKELADVEAKLKEAESAIEKEDAKWRDSDRAHLKAMEESWEWACHVRELWEACYRPARNFGDKEPHLVCRECEAWKPECEKGTPYGHNPNCSIGKALAKPPPKSLSEFLGIVGRLHDALNDAEGTMNRAAMYANAYWTNELQRSAGKCGQALRSAQPLADEMERREDMAEARGLEWSAKRLETSANLPYNRDLAVEIFREKATALRAKRGKEGSGEIHS